ncbi:SusC/RagA family TonB-linked outer membrane protein [Maribacter sp. HTCC2170]|uniref:SusC/RagA family TonB-linked outer membrane protein n=1 Tax=Maribacter sp. (strain HTCC2170 / KCCM 42371) TaxID=313603 RepID=UPI00006AFDA0|nr:SusC/RagA family TonB-linked outer membrane protein [Maribacter sp. HTCC2170]EAR01508.1 putative outer membrane protein, probably involved in nutrient binding [Maribacter sp. HTCC2170]
MKKLFLILVAIGFSISAYAQQTVSGTVLEEGTDIPLLGVSVLVKGTSTGASTDFDGNFSFNRIESNAILVFSYLGYKTQEIQVAGQSTINVSLEVDAQGLDEVVVTALNIQRDKESLGYSISQVSSEEVNVARENNVMNSLSGKVSGLQITQSNTGVDGSSRVLLRGITTISGSNRPLVVVDGIPISNGSGGAGGGGGIDRGDALSDINPDDVASISVLKGAGAAAAYGSLGMNGVILVTTKTGTKKDGIGISLNSSFSFTDVALTPDFQNEYGAGAFGDFAPINADGRPVLDYPFSWSWGPKMEGQAYTNWLGQQDTYSPNPSKNTYKDFYQTGFTMSNTVAFEGRSDKGSFRVAITDEDGQGIVSNNTLAKQTFSIRGTTKLSDKFSVDGKMTYLTSKVRNRPQLAEGAGNTALQLSLMPRDIRLENVANNTINASGEEIKWNLDNTFNNPYWALENAGNLDEKDRFQGFLSANWDIGSKFNVTAKSGMDYIVYDFTNWGAGGAKAISNGLGSYNHDSGKSRIWNSDILATYSTNISDFKITTSVGSTYRNEFSSYRNIWGNDEKVGDFYRISNYKNSFSNEGTSKKGIYSFYGLGQFSYGGYLYFDATIRNDNSSALPKANNSYWYHSENMSILFSKMLGISPNILSQGKLRGSFAKVGNDTGPYRTQAVYNVNQTVTLPYTVASISGSLPSFDLKPETSESWEVGVDLGFLNNRITLDATYYETNTTNQIMAVPLSGTTGYSSKVINAGKIQNKGYEAQLNLIPFDSEDFTWDLGLNFTKSNSKVISLNEGLENISLGSLWTASVEARPGQEFGTIYGNDFLRDNFGRKIIGDDGYAKRGDRVALGNINPDWYGGITSKFRYKNLSLSTLVSIQQGGEYYSYGRGYRMFFGTDARSLVGRETGIIEDGINEHTGFVNDIAGNAMLKQFTDIFSNQVATDLIMDASNVKLREVALTYAFPQTMLKGTFIQSASLSAVGRNLFFIYNAAGDIDPEASYSSGPTSTAFEHSSLPSTRSYGVNLKINF